MVNTVGLDKVDVYQLLERQPGALGNPFDPINKPGIQSRIAGAR